MFKKMFDTPFGVWDIARTHGTKQSHMRTKTLLLTAAVSAAGLATSMAQEVFSVNAVGYVNRAIPNGFSMFSNPLVNSDNTVANLFTSPPNGMTIYKFNNATGAYVGNTFSFGEWGNPTDELLPGDGAFIFNPGAELEITFVGEVMQGDLSNPIPQGFSIKSSQVPQAGQLDTDLGFPVANGDTVYRFNSDTDSYVGSSYSFGEWGVVPIVEVADAFFVFTSAAKSWDRSFDVNATP